MIRPAAAPRMCGSDQLGEPGQAEHVDLELAPRLVDRDVLDRAVGAVAGVVHEYVDPALLVDDPLRRRLTIDVVVGDVHREDRDAVASRGAAIRSTRRATAYTSKPAFRSRWAVSSPMPLDPPVTRATRLLMQPISHTVEREPATDRLGDGAQPGPGDVGDRRQPCEVRVRAGPGGLGGVDGQAAAGAAVGGVLQRDRVAGRAAAGEEVEHPRVVGHGLPGSGAPARSASATRRRGRRSPSARRRRCRWSRPPRPARSCAASCAAAASGAASPSGRRRPARRACP